MVTLTDKNRRGSIASNARVIVLLPAPEGAATTKHTPRRRNSLLKILHLFAHLLHHPLHLQPEPPQLSGTGFAADRIGLAHKLLHQKIQMWANTAACIQQALRRRDMAPSRSHSSRKSALAASIATNEYRDCSFLSAVAALPSHLPF